MYTLTIEQIQKLLDIQKSLETIEVHGMKNTGLMYSSMMLIQSLLDELQKQGQGVSIDNTKEGK
jgi:hypothetical protein